MIGARQPLSRRLVAQLSGHAEVDADGAIVIGDDRELLAASGERRDASVAEQASSDGSRRHVVRVAEDVASMERDGADDGADEMRREGASKVLDLGEFGHGDESSRSRVGSSGSGAGSILTTRRRPRVRGATRVQSRRVAAPGVHDR